MTRPDDAVPCAPGPGAVLAHELQRRTLRGLKRVIRPLWMRRLDERNLHSHEPLVGVDGPIVSLTTHGRRWERVHYTIESIGAGRLKPRRLALWVDRALLAQDVPAPLRRQLARGLELQGCDDVGPHTKYWPMVASQPGDHALVTADDDVLYPAGWLAELVAAARDRPQAVHAHRAHAMSFESEDRFARYEDWPACRSTEPSLLHFATGVGGVLYPPAMQTALREAGTAFLDCCPRADDIWLNAVALRAGFPVRQTRVFSPLLFEVPGTRDHGLARGNVQSGGNDRQLAETYTDDERRRLYALWRAAGGAARAGSTAS